jgi:transcriptional regulator of acetoin/glycerol metabolism
MGKVLTMVEAKRAAIVAALREAGGSPDGAAYMLEIARSTLYRKMREFEIQPREWMDRAA